MDPEKEITLPSDLRREETFLVPINREELKERYQDLDQNLQAPDQKNTINREEPVNLKRDNAHVKPDHAPTNPLVEPIQENAHVPERNPKEELGYFFHSMDLKKMFPNLEDYPINNSPERIPKLDMFDEDPSDEEPDEENMVEEEPTEDEVRLDLDRVEHQVTEDLASKSK